MPGRAARGRVVRHSPAQSVGGADAFGRHATSRAVTGRDRAALRSGFVLPDDDSYDGFPPGFFARSDPGTDVGFYAAPRLVTHIDDDAIAAVGALYAELGLCGAGSGPVLDLMSSWVSHFPEKPASLTVLGMNDAELRANEMADDRVVVDLNAESSAQLPFGDGAFAAAVCCVSVDYLIHPIEVFREVARVVAPGGVFVCTFSNRCFPSKVIRGWLGTNDRGHVGIVREYFRRSGGWGDVRDSSRMPPGHRGDPLFAVWGTRSRSESAVGVAVQR